MPDLNNILNDVKLETNKMNSLSKNLLIKYDNLYNIGCQIFNEERGKSNGNMDGLEDFYSLIQTIRRNRGIIGSITLGIRNLKNMDKFKIMEEDVEETVKKPKKKSMEIKLPVTTETDNA
jgi:hypothetical protein